MRIRYRRALAGAVTAALLLPTTLAAAPAQADSTVGVIGASTDLTGHVAVGIDTGTSTRAALWVRVSVLASTDPGAAVLGSTDAGTSREESTGAQNVSVWTSDDALRLPTDVPRRQYPIQVDYRLPAGTVQHWRSPTTPFDDRLHASVVGTTVDRTQLDYDHRTAVVTGGVDTYDPATGLTGPATAGLTVAVVDSRAGVLATGPTDTAGRFSIALTPLTPLDATVTVPDPPPSVVPVGDGYLPQLTVATEPVRIVGSPITTRVHAGTSITVTGSVQRLSATGWVALSGADVMTASSQYYSNAAVPPALAHGTSTADGRFSYRLTARRTASVFTYATPTPYLGQYNALETDLAVPVRGTYTGSFALDQFAGASFRGRIAGPCAGQAVTLQYSGTGRSGWRSIGSARATQVDGNRCTIAITGAGHPHGYYRVTSAESNGLLAYTGKATYLARAATRITAWKLSPKRPRVNSRITSSGVLQQLRGSAWVGLRGGVVGLVFQPKGDSSYYLMATAHASASGRFTVTAKVYGDGNWGVYYRADSTHLYSETTVRHVDAR